MQGEDWRDFRAKLVASTRAADQGNSVESNGEKWGAWAHEVPNLEQGMLLVAHPHMFTSSQEYFHQVPTPVLVTSIRQLSVAASVMHTASRSPH